ncbi:MAG: bifunctional (p)ppGpp synthetase/guanosine-3',5'-bis(diphosphate) 3'-pyrophosphohydrolase [Phycisphaerales bacterium]|nr:MAG: bifunctional (p)ppGpp synthetase/guanosine-3',5'-bis(diphosphate) 3'-pyrophosphohydrolase [Phycisphaerales bacterium]
MSVAGDRSGDARGLGRPMWQKAVSFAARAHDQQRRKDGKTPFVAHVVRVAMTVMYVFGCDDEEAITAAVLHDTIEDTPTDFDDIDKRFGRPVAEAVAALTKNMLLPEPEREADYDRRLEAAGWRVKLVKLADTYDNCCDIVGEAKATRRAVSRARRAIEIAQRDGSGRPELQRAIAIVGELADRIEADMRSV